MNDLTEVLGTVAMVPKGEYDSSAYYEYLNVVTYEGSTYMAKRDVNNVLPTDEEYWQFIAGGLERKDASLVFDTVADMKSSTKLKDGMTVRTLGYYSLNDGGGATYKITDTESETEYQEEVGDLYATLNVNDYVTPEMFGAYGDGVNDDSIAIQKAIDNFNKIKFGYNKTYKISRQGTSTHLSLETDVYYSLLINKSNIIIDGNKSTLINESVDNVSGFIMNNNRNLENITIKNLNIIMDNTNQSYNPVSGTTKLKSLCFCYVDNINIENISFNKIVGDCIEILDSTNVIIKNITIDDVIGHGLSLGKPSHGIENINVEKCNILNQKEYDGTISTNPVLIGAINGQLKDIYMNNCAWGLKVENPSKNLTIIDSIFEKGVSNSLNTGFKSQGNSDLLKVENITFENCKVIDSSTTGYGFYDTYSLNTIYENCEVINSMGFYLRGTNTLVKNCYLYNAKQGFYIRSESNKVQIKDCIIKCDNADYYENAFINNNASTNEVILSNIIIYCLLTDIARYITFGNCKCDNIYIYSNEIVGSAKFGSVTNAKLNNCNFNAKDGSTYYVDASSGTISDLSSNAFPYSVSGLTALFIYTPYNCTISNVEHSNNRVRFTHSENSNAYIIVHLLGYYINKNS